MQLIQKGGIVMWPLMAVAFLAVSLIVYKLLKLLPLYLRYRHSNIVEEVRILLQKQDFDQAKAIIKKSGPIEEMLLKALIMYS